jgi:hypothetical protein
MKTAGRTHAPRGGVRDEREARGVALGEAVLAEATDLFKNALGKLPFDSPGDHAFDDPVWCFSIRPV